MKGVWLEKHLVPKGGILGPKITNSNKLIIEFLRINCVRDHSASQTLTQTQMILFCQLALFLEYNLREMKINNSNEMVNVWHKILIPVATY